MNWSELFARLINIFTTAPNDRLGLRTMFVVVLALFCVIYLIERLTGSPVSQYQSRNFFHDLTFWAYYRGGFHRLIFNTVLFGMLTPHLSFLKLQVLAGLPALAHYVVYLVVQDFMQYWVHRLQHATRLTWALHTVHHSQERLSFVTLARMHPLELVASDLVFLVTVVVLGTPPAMWLPMYWTWELMNCMQHSEIPWRFGPLYRVFVSPAFHSFHHSIRPEHHDKNFGGLLSIWDFMFGTAVDEKERPKEYGVTDVKMPTLLSTLTVPCQLIYRAYFSADKATPRAAAARSS